MRYVSKQEGEEEEEEEGQDEAYSGAPRSVSVPNLETDSIFYSVSGMKNETGELFGEVSFRIFLARNGCCVPSCTAVVAAGFDFR